MLVYTKTGMPRQKRYVDELKGVPLTTIWTDIPFVNSQAKERLGYPTQKPTALLERIISVASRPGDTVLDPFCGCGTSIDAAQRLGRRWVGIDITILAIDLIKNRIRTTYGSDVLQDVATVGVPNEIEAARELFRKDPFEFERWAVTLVDGQPNERSHQQGDRGIDGIIRFPASIDRTSGVIEKIGRTLVSVKGGKSLNPGMMRDLKGTVGTEGAEMGLMVTLNTPTEGMLSAARGGSYIWPRNGQIYPQAQIVTIDDLLADRPPRMPTPIPPYRASSRQRIDIHQLRLL